MPSFSWLDLNTFLAASRTEFDEFMEKLGRWDREVEKMSKDVRAMWGREKNLLQEKIKDFNREFHQLLSLQDAPLNQSRVVIERRRVRRDMGDLREAYFRATSRIRNADRTGRQKEEATKKKSSIPS